MSKHNLSLLQRMYNIKPTVGVTSLLENKFNLSGTIMECERLFYIFIDKHSAKFLSTAAPIGDYDLSSGVFGIPPYLISEFRPETLRKEDINFFSTLKRYKNITASVRISEINLIKYQISLIKDVSFEIEENII